MKEQIITKKTTLTDVKQKRRIAALRANLRKRKDQVRQRHETHCESTVQTQPAQNQNRVNLSECLKKTID